MVSKDFVHRAPLFAILFSVLGLTYSSYAWVSLQAGSLPFFWSNPTVTFVINKDADPSITDGTDETAIRLAFETWQKVSSSRVGFFEDNSAFSRDRTDWRADDIHMVKWDMNNESGFFSPGTGLVAITPVDFDPSSGQILDADILFNGTKQFSTNGDGGKFDIQNVATHEVGHFIGLDHSAVVGATMNPFANTGDTRLRSLEQDDIAAASTIYATAGEPGSIQGYVMRDGNPVSGAHVVAEDVNGAPASACLSDGNGFFRIRGLDQGSYAVYAEPLDGPVTNANFSLHTSNLTIDTNFGTTFWGASGGRSSPANPDRVNVTFGQASDVGNLNSLPSTNMNLNSISQLTIAPNQEVQVSVYGSNLGSADTVIVPGPPGDGLFVADSTINSSSVRMTLSASPSVLPQLRSVRVFNATTLACAVLTGGFEIRLPGPTITELNNTSGSPGTQVTVQGSNFQNGARVVFGAYVVPASGSGASVSFNVPDAGNGSFSVAVENPDGQFAKLVNAFTISGSTSSGGGSSTSTSNGGSAPTTGNQAPSLPSIPTSNGQSVASGSGGSSSGGGGGGGGGCALAAAPAPVGGLPSGLALLVVLFGLARLRTSRDD